MEKNKIKEILISMKTIDNKLTINYLLKSLEEISDEELQVKFEQLNITEDNIKQYLEDLIKQHTNQESESKKFISVNEFFCYGRTGNTIHMHLIKKDLRNLKKELRDEAFYCYFKEQLEDFLSKLQVMFSEDDSIKSLFAVSPIFYNTNISLIHESLGFDKIIEIDLNNENDDMSIEQKENFINMFNKGEKLKKVYYTKMSKEKLLKMEYSEIADQKPRLKN